MILFYFIFIFLIKVDPFDELFMGFKFSIFF